VLRRLLYVICGLVLVIVVISAVSDRISAGDRAVAPPVTAATGPAAPTVRGTLPRDRTIRARTGDAVTVTVQTAAPDEAAVEALGLQVQTGPGLPGTLEFVAQAPGSYPVELLDADRTAGTIVVTPG